MRPSGTTIPGPSRVVTRKHMRTIARTRHGRNNPQKPPECRRPPYPSLAPGDRPGPRTPFRHLLRDVRSLAATVTLEASAQRPRPKSWKRARASESVASDLSRVPRRTANMGERTVFIEGRSSCELQGHRASVSLHFPLSGHVHDR
ncbi:hypothetical protein BC628DRAFT_844824 [Trametes gibbosa]|nr:hypothetical protein BC628DRAFT_844824 [Trametes gibbosa]